MSVEQMAAQAAQAARQATQQAEQAVQAAQQAARAAGGEAGRQIIDASRTASSQEVGAEREFLVGWSLNAKRTYDSFLQEEMESLRLARRTAEQLAAAHTDHVRNLQAQTLRMQTNSVTHDQDLNAQKLRHNDLSVDRIWNIDEVAQLVAKTPVFLDAISAAVAAGVQAAVAQK
jgi:hypothetical protein